MKPPIFSMRPTGDRAQQYLHRARMFRDAAIRCARPQISPGHRSAASRCTLNYVQDLDLCPRHATVASVSFVIAAMLAFLSFRRHGRSGRRAEADKPTSVRQPVSALFCVLEVATEAKM
jgi:hypothetical protein